MQTKDSVKINTRILKSSIGRRFSKQSPIIVTRLNSLPPLRNALDQYERMKKRNISYHQESDREQANICLTIREIDELCANTQRYCKTPKREKFFLNNAYFTNYFQTMNQKKQQKHNN